MESVDAFLRKAAKTIAELDLLYEHDLQAKQVSSDLQVEVKTVLDQQRSALDHLARRITVLHGNAGPGVQIYFPIATSPQYFPNQMNGRMPGVAVARPDIGDAIERRQPYQPGQQWIGWLNTLRNQNSHEDLTPQTRQEVRRIKVQGPFGQADWQPWDPKTGTGVKFGSGVEIGGVPIDPITQRPIQDPSQVLTDTIYVDWLFGTIKRPVRRTLMDIQAGVEAVIGELCALAGL